MICLGSPQSSPTNLESEAAQLRIVQLFRANFTSRYPDGIVISELEYMGRTTAAPNQPGPLRITGAPGINIVLEALSEDFRRWVTNRDYRKCDAMGIAGNGRYAELLEVTTANNAASAATQITSKVAILRETVNRIHNLSVDWRPSPWRPAGQDQMFYSLPSNNPGKLRYLCYYPTERLVAVPGVILYEVHEVERPRVPVPVTIPEDARNRIQRAARANRPTEQTADGWARQFLDENPNVGAILRGLAAAVGIVLLLAAVILIFDPVPGDEAAAFSAAMALLRLAGVAARVG